MHHGTTVHDAKMQPKRTTVTLEPDVEALLGRAMKEKGLTFRAGAERSRPSRGSRSVRAPPTPTPTVDMGEPLIDVTQALRLAGELEAIDANVLLYAVNVAA